MTVLVILLVILIFGFLVFIHELGHFVAARRNGVEVHEFGFGFPPRLVGKKIGKTEYSINLIPLGGFVKLKGENLTDTTAGSFGGSSFWAKTKILFAGVTMNALFAWLILVGLCLFGLPPVINNQYSHGSVSYAQPKQVMVVGVESGSPAEQAGIKRGEVIIAADGQRLESEQQLLDFTKNHAGQKVDLDVTGDNTHSVAVQLRPADAKSGFLGVTPFQTYKIKYGFIDAIVTATGLTLQLMWVTLTSFVGLISGLFVHGQVSDQVAGPVGIVVLLKNILDFGVSYVLIYFASISISLAVVNPLPLPALDGGRWLLAAVQKVSRRQLSENTEALVHAAGFIALILLMVVVTYFDMRRLG